ncbi:MAG TPA: L-seryl-tRNA(Sec) selenium transferase [Planctomycetota bacterium]|nr:L-seryl-tRNA(Sec) selenium transferase [Planctomycetota bacterium]
MASKSGSKAAGELRKIPSVDQLTVSPAGEALVQRHGRDPVVAAVREELEAVRALMKSGGAPSVAPADLLAGALKRLESQNAPRLCRVINATGVILHTGLGRAVLAKAALDAIASVQRGYSLLETERESGERSIRETHVVTLLQKLTGAEAATVVNNNAGATLIALAAMAQGKEVIVSRGQLVEIGGSFRIPDVMEQSGCKLVDVGTTNKTYVSDYEKKIGHQTGLLLRVHTSNFRIVGFTASPTLEELIALGKKHGLPVMDDLGSGALVDMGLFGIQGEPGVAESVKAGADVITFSGDKLLGGPQAGILLGSKKWISQIRKNPLFRALRVDKLTLTALEATLKIYFDRERLMKDIPILAMLGMAADELERRALDLAAKLKAVPGVSVEILDDSSEVGGGSVPAHALPTKVVALRVGKTPLATTAAALRMNEPSIFARVQRDRILFDVRTLLEGEADEIAAAVAKL